MIMKKFLWLSLLICYSNISTFASKKIVGQIIYPNDTVSVTFLIPTQGKNKHINYIKLQHKVKFIDSSGKKNALKPDNALEIRFKFEGKPIRMVSVPKKDWLFGLNISSKNIFLRILSDGKIKMYNMYESIFRTSSVHTLNGTLTGSSPTNMSNSTIVIKIGNKIVVPSDLLNFKEKMIEYLSDCPELTKLINERNMSAEYLPWIINEYNKKCGNR